MYHILHTPHSFCVTLPHLLSLGRNYREKIKISTLFQLHTLDTQSILSFYKDTVLHIYTELLVLLLHLTDLQILLYTRDTRDGRRGTSRNRCFSFQGVFRTFMGKSLCSSSCFLCWNRWFSLWLRHW